jgi:hypothetical protein
VCDPAFISIDQFSGQGGNNKPSKQFKVSHLLWEDATALLVPSRTETKGRRKEDIGDDPFQGLVIILCRAKGVQDVFINKGGMTRKEVFRRLLRLHCRNKRINPMTLNLLVKVPHATRERACLFL